MKCIMASDPSSAVKELIAAKERIENEILELHHVLQSVKSKPYITEISREWIIKWKGNLLSVIEWKGLKNDLNDMMKEIESGLHAVHASAKLKKTASNEKGFSDSNVDTLEPFLKVDLVSSDSPAAMAGLLHGDLILQFGTVAATNFSGLSSIASIVQHSKGQPLPLIVKRCNVIHHLTLTPNKWSGQGLLGCNVVTTR